MITPIYGEDGIVTNHAEVIIGNADNDPVTREKINEAVQSALQSEGLIEGAFPCYQRYGERTREEAERVGNIEAVSAGLSSARASAPEEAGTAPAMSAHSRKA